MVHLWNQIKKATKDTSTNELQIAAQSLFILKGLIGGMVSKRELLNQRVAHFQLTLTDLGISAFQFLTSLEEPSPGDQK